MDITTITPQPKSQPTGQSAAQDVAVPKPKPEPPKSTPAYKLDPKLAEQEREAIIREVASKYKDVYAVSDTTFSLFKDGNGQIITRFTDLKSGEVVYIPELEMMQFIEKAKRNTHVEDI